MATNGDGQGLKVNMSAWHTVIVEAQGRVKVASGPWQNRDKTHHVELTWVGFERKADSPSY